MNMMIFTPNSNSSLAFLQEIFQGADAGFVVIWLKVGKTDSETYSFPVTDLEGAPPSWRSWPCAATPTSAGASIRSSRVRASAATRPA